MKQHLAAACILFALFSGWTTGEKAGFGFMLGVKSLDWRQTIKITESDDYYELNPILGKYPSRSAVNNYFLATTVASYIVADQVGGRWRPTVIAVMTVISAAFVSHNIQMGIRW